MSKTNYPYASVLLDFCEQTAPKAKQAVDDWKSFCTACMDGGSKIQRTAMKSAGLQPEAPEGLDAAWKNLAHTLLDAQAEFSKTSIDIALKATRTFLKND